MNGNGYNNSYGGSMNDRGLGALSRAMVFIVLLVGVLVAAAVIGLMRDPIEAAQAAGIMVGVARSEADLVADTPQMPAISAAEAGAQIAQIQSESQTRAVYDDTTRRNIIANQQYKEAVAAEELAHTQDMHQIYERLVMGGGVALITLVGLGAGWYFYTEINSRLAVQGAARSAQAAQAQLAAARAVAAAQTLTAARPAVTPATVATPTSAPSPVRPTRPEPVAGRLPDLPTGRPRRERPTQPQPAQPQPAPAPAALAVTSIPPHRWLETIGHGNGAYPNGNGHSLNGNGHSLNGNGHSSNGNGHNGRHG